VLAFHDGGVVGLHISRRRVMDSGIGNATTAAVGGLTDSRLGSAVI